MKNIKTILVLILAIGLFNQVQAQIVFIKQDSTQFTKAFRNTEEVISQKSSLVIEQSKTIFPTKYKIVKSGVPYYTNSLFLFERQKSVRFNCYRNGQTTWYIFPFRGLKVYQSK